MKNTVSTFKEQKVKGDKITMLTAYDYSTAKLMDRLSYGMKLWKEDDPKLPMLPIKEYENQVADGADGYCILGRMANDYKKLIHPVKKYQRER